MPAEYDTLARDHQLGTFQAEYAPRVIRLIFVAASTTVLSLLGVWLAMFLFANYYMEIGSTISAVTALLALSAVIAWWRVITGLDQRVYLYKNGIVLSLWGALYAYNWRSIKDVQEKYAYSAIQIVLVGILISWLADSRAYSCKIICEDGRIFTISSVSTVDASKLGAICVEKVAEAHGKLNLEWRD